jgi:E3 ubiquitin-protein ligase CBL
LKLQESDGQGCPFCRTEIKGTEQVIVDPFDPTKLHARESEQGQRCVQNQLDMLDDDDVSFEVCFLMIFVVHLR